MSDVHSITLLSDEAFGWYFSGLTDGEGYFDLHKSKQVSPKGRVRFQWQPRFHIKMRDDEWLNLAAVRQRLGCGTLTWTRGQIRLGKQCNPQANFKVLAIAHVVGVIVPHFERFPLQFKKARDFAIWKRGVCLINGIMLRSTYRRWTPPDHAALDSVVDELKACRKYDSSRIASPSGRAAKDDSMPLFDNFGLHE